jgi:hypothetical protein
LALSSASASQKARWVMKLSLLHNKRAASQPTTPAPVNGIGFRTEKQARIGDMGEQGERTVGRPCRGSPRILLFLCVAERSEAGWEGSKALLLESKMQSNLEHKRLLLDGSPWGATSRATGRRLLLVGVANRRGQWWEHGRERTGTVRSTWRDRCRPRGRRRGSTRSVV